MENSLLGVRINYPFLKKDFQNILSQLINKKDSSFIFTINPEFIVDAQRDLYFKNILNKGSFNSADGIGVVIGLVYKDLIKTGFSKYEALYIVFKRFLKGSLVPSRFTGVEISERIFEYCDENYLSIFLLGGDKKKLISENLLLKLEKKYKNINFVGASSSFSSKPNDDLITLEFIKKCMRDKGVDSIDFILVGYGHPYQEKWIDRNFSKINIRIFVGVGGTFDFMTGNLKRAPLILQKLGVEWFYRLMQEPKRFKRIFKAVVVFSYLIFTKIKQLTKKN